MATAVETFQPTRSDATALGVASPLAKRVEHTLLAALGIQVGFLVPSFAAYLIDERLLNDISVWSKPLKFQSSLSVMIGTLLLLLPVLRIEAITSRLARGAALTLPVSATLEIAYLTLQAARGRASHFNDSTQLEATLYPIMGVGALALVVCSFIFGWMIWWQSRPEIGVGLRTGAAWGLMMSAVLTLVTAGVLSSGAIDGPGHWVGGIKTDAGGLFLVGWSRTGGDLRVPHFFATHIMQALPLLGLALDRFRPQSARAGAWIGAVLSAAIVAATFVQALSGRPLF